MCGIAGILHPDSEVRARIRPMLDVLRHRGPDGEGCKDIGGAVLGHRRLSIIDLEGGRQPLCNAAGTLWLVCNGEIYNYAELRSQLEARGHRFLTHSDCEVIIGLYEQYGDRLLEHLRGMFSFALWDVKRRRLLAARDHLGQKPFFYTDVAGCFAFASEIKSLLAYEPALRELDLQALEQYLALRLIAPPLTMFRGVHKLPPGHKLVLEHGAAPVVSAYWDLRFTPKIQGTEEQLVDALEERIDEALRLHLVSDVKVGAFLSGGLDSSLLVAMLCKRLGRRDLPTFTLGLAYRRFDEAPFARLVAQQFHTEHHEQTIQPSLLSLLPDLVWHLDEPSDPLSLCAYQVSELASRHVKVVIGGDGGDELFGGYDRYYGNLYAGLYSRIPASVRRYVVGPCVQMVPESGWYKSVGHQLRWLQRLSFLDGGARYAASLSYFYFDEERRAQLLSARAREQLEGSDATRALRDPFDSLDADTADRMLYTDSKVRLPDHPVMITDRMSMAHGLEARSPFMDHRLAEFAASLPWTVKIRGRQLRIIQRKLAERYLPPQVLERPKQGFSSALPYLLRQEYRVLCDRYLRDAELVRAGIFEASSIERLLSEHFAGRSDHGNRLWLLINSEIWYRMLILRQPREDLRITPLARLDAAA
ncbi:MAG TPA: asparagine synthase (glutamine-hydrolyzing) [Steroidobacteraceae bacterium]|jgi:asparagine synthase (glutamine-hydrolysing)|nr:asparagine synthase (glutamine-hydrolyzing) [Steroidobacteraceae bacterium]